MRGLVYRMGGLGDSIFIYPILEILTKRGYEMFVWGKTDYFQFAEIAKYCKKASFYKPSWDSDFSIIFSRNRDIFQNKNTVFVSPIPEERVWIVDYYLKSLGLEGNDFSKKLQLSFNADKDYELCIIHPGSGSWKKNPEIDFFLKLENKLNKRGLRVRYLLGPAERKIFNILKNAIYFEDLKEVAKILLSASLYIGVDSGLSHLSSYLGVNSIVIFGPSDPVIWRPIGESVSIIRYENCSPCFPNLCQDRKCLSTDFLISEVLNLIDKIF